MALTKADWEHRQTLLRNRQETETPNIVYKTIDESIAWTQLKEWIEEYLKKEKGLLDDSVQHFIDTGNYAFDGLASEKARMDIRNGRVLLLEEIQEKILEFHNKEE